MQRLIATGPVAAAILAASAVLQPLAAQTRQQQVGAEAARSTAGAVEACPLLTVAEVSEYADSWTRSSLEEDGLYDMGSTCDYGGFVTVRVFAGDDPEAQVEWLFTNYQVDAAARRPIDGFGAGAYLVHLKPPSEYQDEAAGLVGRAGPAMFMVTMIPQEGETVESVRPHLEALSRIVMGRLR